MADCRQAGKLLLIKRPIAFAYQAVAVAFGGATARVWQQALKAQTSTLSTETNNC